MSTHVRTTIRNCYFHLRQLRLVRHSLTKESAHALVRAMIHCRLDYCNSVLSNQPMYVYNNLQSVLRTAARLVLKLPGYASVTEIMRKDLHWLGFPQRISYKLCTLTYKCLHGMAPDYLTRRFTLVSSVDGRSHLRSAARWSPRWSRSREQKQSEQKVSIIRHRKSGTVSPFNCVTVL